MKKAIDIFNEIENEVLRFNKSFEIDDENMARTERSESASNIDDLVIDYNKALKNELYAELVKSETPMVDAIKKFYVPVLKVIDVKNDEGIVIGKTVYNSDGMVNIDNKTINILDFDKQNKYTLAEKGWQYKLEKFNQLMCLKVANELGYTKGEMSKIVKTYYISDLAKKIDMGETPTSNTKALVALQSLIDSIIYKDNGNGKNVYKATSHDIVYIDKLFCKKGKNALSLSVSNSALMRELVTRVLYRIVVDGKYSVDHKVIKK